MTKIEEIRERWKKVTPGPWALDPAFWSPPSWGETMHYRRVVHGEPNQISGIRRPLFSTNGAADGSEQATQNHHDAAAVAAAPDDVAWLLAEVDRLKAQVAAFSSARDAAKRGWQQANEQVEDLQRQLAEAVGQTEAAKQAAREIMAERNTWARQLADMRDERDTAREETEKEREMYSLVSNDRDNLHAEMDTLAQDYVNNKYTVYHRGHQVARDIRRVIARWETT